MKKISNLFRRSVLSPSSSSSSSPPRRDSGVPPFSPDSYIIKVQDLDKIHKAAALGDVMKVQELLLLEQAGVDDRDKKGRTPLHLACANGYPDVVSLLVERKCKLNLLDNEDQTPLMKAVQYQQEECTTILLEHGADACAMDTHHNTALHYAVLVHNIKIAVKLLRYKIEMEAKNKEGCTPLLLAVIENDRDMVDLFLKNGANVNTSDMFDRTPLMIAARSNRTGVVSLLLQYDIDISCEDKYGQTAEGYASSGGCFINRLLIKEYRKQKTLNQPLSPQICSSERASDPKFTLGEPDKDQEDLIEELDLDDEDVIDATKNQPGSRLFTTFPFKDDEAFGAVNGPETGFSVVILGEKPDPQKQFEAQLPIKKEQDEEGPSDWDFSSTSLKTESSRKSKDSNFDENHPWQSVPVTRIQCGPTPRIRNISILEDEAVGAASGPETEFEVLIRGQKSVPQKQVEPQFPVKILESKEDSLQRYLNLKPILPTSEIKYSFSNQDLGKGIKGKEKSFLKKQLGFSEADDTDGPSDWDSCSTSLETESHRKCKGLNLDEIHPCQLLSVTKIQCESTLFGKIPFQGDETVGAGSDTETELRLVIRGEKWVSQKEDEPHLPVKQLKVKEGLSDWDSCSTSLKTESYGKSKDLNFDEKHPCQSLPVTKNQSGSPALVKITFKEDQAVGAGSGPETEFRVVIRGEKSVPQKQNEPQFPVKQIEGTEGNEEACRGSSEECLESFVKSDLQQGKVQMDANDRNDHIQASDTATEDYDLPPLNYPNRRLKIEDVVLRYDRSVERKKAHCTLLARRVKSLENQINELREELSETREMKSQLDHQKAEWNRELCSVRFILNQEEMKRVTTEMLFENNREQFRRKEEQYSKAVGLNQRLECTLRSLEVELRTIRNHLQQVEEELNDIQRQLVQEQRARALQATILNNLLRQKEKEVVASTMTQTSEVPDSNEIEKCLLDKNQILQDEVAMLKLELDTVKMEHQEKENHCTEEIEVLKEKIDELQKKLQLNEEALTKTISQYSGQINVLTAENEVLNSKLEKAKRNRDTLKTEIASYHSRLTSAIHRHEQNQTSKLALEQSFQGSRDEWLHLQDKLNHDLSSLRDNGGVLSQELSKAESKANSLESELNCVHDSLREKTLILESTQKELTQAQHKAKEFEHIIQLEKEKLKKYIVKYESLQERLAQISRENMLFWKQLEDAQNKDVITENVLSDIRGKFMDCFNNFCADTGKQVLMIEEKNKELTRECNHIRELMCKYEKEKVEGETTVRKQQELVDALKEQSMTKTSLEITSFDQNDFEVEKKLPKERDETKSKLYTEREKLKKLTELNQSLESRLERELKRNDELQKDLSGFKRLLKPTKKKLREYEKGDVVYQGGVKQTYSEMDMDTEINSLKDKALGEQEEDRYTIETLVNVVYSLGIVTGVLKTEDLRQQLETESSTCNQLKSINESQGEEPFSVKILQTKCAKLEGYKRELEEEVVNLRHHLEITKLERSEIEQYKREIDEQAKQRIIEKLKEVNLFLQTQATVQNNLEQLRENNNTSIRNQMEQQIRDLESKVYKKKLYRGRDGEI